LYKAAPPALMKRFVAIAFNPLRPQTQPGDQRDPQAVRTPADYLIHAVCEGG
jgi:hypothetical protein